MDPSSVYPVYPVYPVHVEARLDPGLSRWLWLVKWLLVIPHLFVLFVLWLVFMVLTVVAFFAILFTAHYPRSIFDLNVGVFRWGWRVSFYSYGVLGTDRYPPFSLYDVPDYPARLSIDYPERLSRGLVLVKWWLLAIPQYLVVTILSGGGSTSGGDDGGDQWWWAGGLIGLLVLFAAIALLFSGRYPRSIFDLVVGLQRWTFRVAAYAFLLTDEYPPFRLDQGGEEPVAAVAAAP
ncbi:DUF4389 domain-containing protein [Cellulomonas sp. P22]|uniref:DUF4389 domain-containing protein n=1 Tax=Cellulomonas sp. P22 TaxID=3373189 RepID=UPI0037BE00B2